MVKLRRYVEIGRVVLIKFGKFRKTLAVITDVIDHNYVLCDGRCLGGSLRAARNIKDLGLTDIKIRIGHGIRHRYLKKKVEEAKVQEQWNASKIGQRMAKLKAKRKSTDLERWRVRQNKKQRSLLIKLKYLRLKRQCFKIAKKMTQKKPERTPEQEAARKEAIDKLTAEREVVKAERKEKRRKAEEKRQAKPKKDKKKVVTAEMKAKGAAWKLKCEARKEKRSQKKKRDADDRKSAKIDYKALTKYA
eukprot:NODE_1443_length_913_cov_486.510417_g1114_i0.p1 GENE.NODE_1443_length_913_cov_486.510417_g1114_i0~~NODE_1443_length_913_cov_486.510417_g1114_i0.p1  ORF type:complete len:247 (-),score=53.42 NODE_1443_length_913_cov_486.510417_g1114_i0:101-841(-)